MHETEIFANTFDQKNIVDKVLGLFVLRIYLTSIKN